MFGNLFSTKMTINKKYINAGRSNFLSVLCTPCLFWFIFYFFITCSRYVAHLYVNKYLFVCLIEEEKHVIVYFVLDDGDSGFAVVDHLKGKHQTIN